VNLSPVAWLSDSQYKSARPSERVIAWADSQVGVREKPLGSNRGPEVKQYLEASGLGQGHPWCAAFLYWCCLKAGRPASELPRKSKSALVANWRAWAVETGRKRDTAERGRIGYWVNANGTGHIFICLGKPILGVFRTIEGNTDGESGSREGDGVYKRTRTMWGLKNRYAHGFIEL